MPPVLQGSFTGGELAPALAARADFAKYAVGLKTCRNFFVHPQGGVSNRPGFEFIHEVRSSAAAARLIPFRFSTSDAYALEFGDYTMRVVRLGAIVLESDLDILGATQANPVVITTDGAHSYSAGDEVYIDDVGGMTELNGRFFTVANPSGATFELSGINGTGYTAYTSGGTVARVYTLTTPWAAADLARLEFTQSADTMWIVHPGYAARKLTRTGHAAWSISTITFAPTISAPTGVGTTVNGTPGSTTYKYVVTAVKEETYEESVASSTATESSGPATLTATDSITIDWTGSSGALKYNVYKQRNNVFGYIGSSEGLDFTDDGIEPDLADTPPRARNPFSGAKDYPSRVTIHDQRTTYASTLNKPDTVWMSNAGAYDNLNISEPTKDDDAITFTIGSPQGNDIRALISLGNLLILTSGDEWLVRPAGDSDILTPYSVQVKAQGYRGCSNVAPLIVGSSVLYVQAQGASVRQLRYRLESDGYQSIDLSILAKHLFDDHSIVSWCYAQTPHSIVWAVRDDGLLLGLTYVEEHDVWAWHRHDTAGSVESLCSIPEGSEDAVYAVIRRTIAGADVRYIERMHSRSFSSIEDAFFVDAGLTYDSAPATIFSGLDHLEGETVSILADGSEAPQQTVTDGSITLTEAASVVHVGLPIEADFETLGILEGRRQRIGQVRCLVQNTRGLWAGPDSNHLTEWKQRRLEPYGTPIDPYTGESELLIVPDWKNYARIFIRQSGPLPVTILGVIPEVAVAP